MSATPYYRVRAADALSSEELLDAWLARWEPAEGSPSVDVTRLNPVRAEQGGRLMAGQPLLMRPVRARQEAEE